MTILKTKGYLFFLVFIALTFQGCFYSGVVRHLASDVSLVVPDNTTQSEVLSYMGSPQLKYRLSAAEEKWIYYQAKKSFLRKMPLLGSGLGTEKYNVVIIIFDNQTVKSREYREFPEDEFKNQVVKSGEARIE